ncbi:Protein kinase-like domain [Pseudocohnilembus persalinus]|uniref:Protein kinase-like domain n=1 Tax=Pseudocohnilembus persalinus TaxID=266149 RepID=A0A0V0QNT7_PSEPJ|nr:Protein kinase-like domain [Pseudocohnilembus persalinus]|eukprot:KRX03899.1 Protein kinase-like domain [Pseudocohnilembus persalinus]
MSAGQKNPEQINHAYNEDKFIGNGTFGVVYQDTDPKTGDPVAIKKVFQDKRYKNRELQIMSELKDHPNVIYLREYYMSQGNDPDEVYLHLVMDFIPETLNRVIKFYSRKRKTPFPNILLKLYSYQLLRSLAYISNLNICHRDIKPTNILVDPRSHMVKLCDFGSAKKLIKGEPNISYICSRYYRAPELIYGATQYTHQIDVWSIGCVIAEMILGEPIFAGDTSVDQLVEIIKILGSPTAEDLFDMNPHYQQTHKIPQIKAKKWKKVFKGCNADPVAIDFISKLLVYSPRRRIRPLQALLHPYFDELRQENCKINGQQIPNLFNFLEVEIGSETKLLPHLIPKWYQKKQQQQQQ